MFFELVMGLLRKHLFVVNSDTYLNETQTAGIKRIYAKHPRLKPEVVVINDQPVGFKQSKDKYQSLDQFSIFVEFEYNLDSDGHPVSLENFELYSDVLLDDTSHLKEIDHFASLYKKTIHVDYVKSFGDDSGDDHIYVYSKIPERLEEFKQDELSLDVRDLSEFLSTLEVQLIGFLNFIQILDHLFLQEDNPLSYFRDMVSPSEENYHEH